MKLFKDYSNYSQSDFVEIAIKGKSMFPYLQEGDKILACFSPLAIEELDIGQLAFYFDGGELTVHRLIKISHNKAFKADRGVILERPTKILGKCVGVIRKNKKIFYKKNMIFPQIISKFSSWHYQTRKHSHVRKAMAFMIILFSKIHLVQEIIFGGTKSIFDRN